MPVKNALLCFLAAFIWGTAFVAQRIGGEALGPYTMNGVRFLFGFAALLPVILIRRKAGITRKENGEDSGYAGTAFAGFCCGCCLLLASTLQQVAIMHTDVGKAGFLTALYIVIVPVMSLAIGRRSEIKIWISVAIALAGLYFLCMSETLRLSMPDLLLIACAAVFSLHIMVIDHFTEKCDPVEMSCIQFLTAGTLGTILCIVLEHPDFTALPPDGLFALIYAGVFSSGIAYTLQIIGQKGADPAIASLILSLESVISAIAGLVILHQRLSVREIIGCALMFTAIILVQFPGKKEKLQNT